MSQEETMLAAPASEPIPDSMVRELYHRAIAWDPMSGRHATYAQKYERTVCRKEKMFKRWQVWRHDLTDLISERVNTLHKNQKVREGIKASITSTLNPAVDIVTAVCQVYKHGATRSITGASDEENAALHALLLQGRIDSLSQEWNRVAFFVGPLAVLPRVRSKRFSFDTILPYAYDVVLDSDDPTGTPTAIVYRPWSGSAVDLVIVDRFSSRFYRDEKLTKNLTLVDEEKHARRKKDRDIAPFSILRFDPPFDGDDWYNENRNQRLADGTIEVGIIGSSLSYIRKIQNKHLLVASGDLEGLPRGHSLTEAEGAVELHMADPQASTAEVKTLPYDTAPDNSIKHIRFMYESLAESTGVQVVRGNPADATAKPSVEFSYDGLTEVRNDQISYARDFDRDLTLAAILAAKQGRHPLWSDLPSIDEARENIGVSYGRLARRFSDPTQEIKVTEWDLAHGLENINSVVQRDDISLSEKQAELKWQRNMDVNESWWDRVSKRQMPADGEVPPPRTTKQQADGAQGGRPPNEEEDSE